VSPKFKLTTVWVGVRFRTSELRPGGPSLLSPFLGGNLHPPKHQLKNLEPALGSPGRQERSNDRIRAGMGIFYDTQEGWWRRGSARYQAVPAANSSVTPSGKPVLWSSGGSGRLGFYDWQILFPLALSLSAATVRAQENAVVRANGTFFRPRSTFQSRQTRGRPFIV